MRSRQPQPPACIPDANRCTLVHVRVRVDDTCPDLLPTREICRQHRLSHAHIRKRYSPAALDLHHRRTRKAAARPLDLRTPVAEGAWCAQARVSYNMPFFVHSFFVQGHRTSRSQPQESLIA